MRRYLLDASVFITVKNCHGLNPRGAFWAWLITANRAGRVRSILEIYEELQGHEDDLSKWARQHRHGFFLPCCQGVTQARQNIGDWAKVKYTPEAFDEFSEAADSWLVAYALVHGHIVVTYETRIPNNKIGDVKIPNACDRFGIASMDPNTMLRNEGADFRV